MMYKEPFDITCQLSKTNLDRLSGCGRAISERMATDFLPSILLILFILMLPVDPLLAQLQRQPAVESREVELTFMAPRNINLYTVHHLSAGELHYSIMHTFGEVKSGARNLWGVDQGANVRFSLELGLTDRVSVGFGRSSMDKVIDVSSRIALLRQTTGAGMPVSVSAIPAAGINTSDFSFLQDDYLFADRLSFSLSVPVARKFNNELSVQVTPILAHFNRVGGELSIADPEVNTWYSVGLSARYKVRPRTALSLQYIPAIMDANNLTDNLAIGIDIETGGHVFQMFFTTARALHEPYLIAGENGDFFAREFRFGFNINRLFRVY